MHWIACTGLRVEPETGDMPETAPKPLDRLIPRVSVSTCQPLSL